jgi:SAM-dependent methyltransferase
MGSWNGMGDRNLSLPSIEKLRGPLKPSVARLFDKYYGDWDPLYLVRKIRSYSPSDGIVLDFGAGSGKAWPNGLRGAVSLLVGIDPTDEIACNQDLDEAVRAVGESLPFKAQTFDVVFSHSVVEHLSDPLRSFREIARVLKPGGVLLLQTPNLYYYPMVISRWVPHKFHHCYLSWLGTRGSSPEKEIFPTFYRSNTVRSITSLLTKCGLEIVEIETLPSPPGYLRFSPVAFFLGVLYERTFERIFPSLRAVIVCVASKGQNASTAEKVTLEAQQSSNSKRVHSGYTHQS